MNAGGVGSQPLRARAVWFAARAASAWVAQQRGEPKEALGHATLLMSARATSALHVGNRQPLHACQCTCFIMSALTCVSGPAAHAVGTCMMANVQLLYPWK